MLDPEEVKARFHVHFQSDKVHAEQGVLSTDEATERRRWRMIVTGVLTGSRRTRPRVRRVMGPLRPA